MPDSDVVFVECQLSRSGFSNERVFRLETTTPGEEFIGTAPVQYCRTKAKKPLSPDEPEERKHMKGLVEARVIRKEPDGSVWLYFPDGSVAQVSEKLLGEQQSGKAPDVPLKS